MKSTISVLVLFTFISPALALFDCWEEQTPESLVAGSERVVVGFVKDVKFVGCVLENGKIAVCPQPVTGQFMPDRAYVVQFEVTRLLKGPDGRFIEFLVVIPSLLAGCEGPGMAKGIETLAFIRQQNDRPTAWGGDYALCQRSRQDCEKLLAQAETVSRRDGDDRDGR